MFDSLFANGFISMMKRTEFVAEFLIFLILKSIGIYRVEVQSILSS